MGKVMDKLALWSNTAPSFQHYDESDVASSNLAQACSKINRDARLVSSDNFIQEKPSSQLTPDMIIGDILHVRIFHVVKTEEETHDGIWASWKKHVSKHR